VTDVLSAFAEGFQVFSPFRIAHRLARDVKREDIPALSRARDGRALLRVIEEGPDRSAKRVTRDEEEVATERVNEFETVVGGILCSVRAGKLEFGELAAR
jgi:hypothetical protein